VGDIYEGEFKEWKRHGYGTQQWLTGELYRGTWASDRQLEGIHWLYSCAIRAMPTLVHVDEINRCIY
jgi:hypothetical protein